MNKESAKFVEDEGRTTHQDKIIGIAKITHDVIRSYHQTMGDNSFPAWEMLSPERQTSTVKDVEFCLSGECNVQDIHEQWCRHKIVDGWNYALVYNEDEKQDPNLKPFQQLTFEQQMTYGLIMSIAIWASPALARSAAEPKKDLTH